MLVACSKPDGDAEAAWPNTKEEVRRFTEVSALDGVFFQMVANYASTVYQLDH